MKVIQLINGDEFLRIEDDILKALARGGIYKMSLICCDCAKEEILIFEKEGKNIVARVYRDDRATLNNRKRKKRKR